MLDFIHEMGPVNITMILAVKGGLLTLSHSTRKCLKILNDTKKCNDVTVLILKMILLLIKSSAQLKC